VQLSDEAERKLADQGMKEWSKDQEEYVERQYQEVQERKEEIQKQLPPEKEEIEEKEAERIKIQKEEGRPQAAPKKEARVQWINQWERDRRESWERAKEEKRRRHEEIREKQLQARAAIDEQGRKSEDTRRRLRIVVEEAYKRREREAAPKIAEDYKGLRTTRLTVELIEKGIRLGMKIPADTTRMVKVVIYQ
jgi:hypothetical protein